MDALIAVGLIIGGLFGIMLSFYLVLCFIQWVSDVIEEKRWYMGFIWRIGVYGMSDGRIKQLAWLTMMIGSITIWYFIIKLIIRSM